MESLPVSSSPLPVSSPSSENTLSPPNDPTSSLPSTPTPSTPLQLTPSQPPSTSPPPFSTQSPVPSSESSTSFSSVQSSKPYSSTSSSASSSLSSTSIISSLSTLTASSTSIFQSTIIGTSDGQVYTTVVQSTTVLALGTDVTGIGTWGQNKGGSSNVGAIVGGLVGGIGGALALSILLLLFLRRKKKARERSSFDGNFDPSRIVQPAHPSGSISLLAGEDNRATTGAGITGIVTPFVYHPAAETRDVSSGTGVIGMGVAPGKHPYEQRDAYQDAHAASASPEGRQYSSPPPTTEGGTSTSSEGQYYTATPRGLPNPYKYYAPNPSSPSSSGAVLASSGNAKEREAYARYDGAQQTPLGGSGSGGTAVANPDGNVEMRPDFLSGSGSSGGVRSRRSGPHRQ